MTSTTFALKTFDARFTLVQKILDLNSIWNTKAASANAQASRFAEDLAAAYFCAIDAATPLRVKGMLLAALAYFVMPLDVIPDFVAGLGFTDDAAVLAMAIGAVSRHLKPEHHARARAALGLPQSAPVHAKV